MIISFLTALGYLALLHQTDAASDNYNAVLQDDNTNKGLSRSILEFTGLQTWVVPPHTILTIVTNHIHTLPLTHTHGSWPHVRRRNASELLETGFQMSGVGLDTL